MQLQNSTWHTMEEGSLYPQPLPVTARRKRKMRKGPYVMPVILELSAFVAASYEVPVFIQ
jgi:hypothetical protein